jgi:CRP-like cAMP-binding protein
MVDRRTEALERFLSRLLLRSALTDEEASQILSLGAQPATIDAHRDITRPGDTHGFACLVAEGLAGRFDQLANGLRQITALHIPGDMCDLHSVPVPHAGWGIEALAKTTIFKFPHEALKDLMFRYPAIALAFWRDTIVDSSVLAKWLSALGRRTAKQRLAHLICEMGIRMEQAGLGSRTDFTLQITQSQLADVLGITAVHLNRSLQALRAEGLLLTDNYRIRVPDETRLCALAEFDPGYLLLDVEGEGMGAAGDPATPTSVLA